MKPSDGRIERGAWKFERWLDKQKTAKELVDIEYKKDHPDRYFVAFIKLDMPRCSAWPKVMHDTLLFEQPQQVDYDDIMRVANKVWTLADKIELINFYEMSASDFAAFTGNESEWGVIEE